MNVPVQSVCSSGKASGFASQTFQVMSQIGIDSLHRISFFLVRSHFVWSSIIVCVINRECVTVVLFGLRCFFQACLQRVEGRYAPCVGSLNSYVVSKTGSASTGTSKIILLQLGQNGRDNHSNKCRHRCLQRMVWYRRDLKRRDLAYRKQGRNNS